MLSEDFHLHQEYYRLTLARIRLAQGRYAEVEEIAGRDASLDVGWQSNNQADRIQFAPGRCNRWTAAPAGSF